MVRSAGLAGFSQLSEKFGVNPSSIFSKVELSPQLLSNEESLIPAEKVAALLEVAAEMTDCSEFGIRLGLRQQPSILGLIGLSMHQCSNLGEALDVLQRFLFIHSQAGNLEIKRQDKLVSASYESLVSFNGSSRQLTDLSLCVGFQILKQMTNKKLKLSGATFRYSKPTKLQIYEDVFNTTLQFNNEKSSLLIYERDLALPIKNSFSDFSRFINERLTESKDRLSLGNIEHVSLLIKQLLPTGHCSLDSVAQILAIDSRTLQRRLKEQGTTYQQLLDDQRFYIAKHYMHGSDVSMTQLSLLLGFAEPSILTRKFKSWSGVTPTEYIRASGSRLKLRS